MLYDCYNGTRMSKTAQTSSGKGITRLWFAVLATVVATFTLALFPTGSQNVGSLVNANPATSSKADSTSITGRLHLAKGDGCLIARIYLKNTQNKQIQIISGCGGVDDDREVCFLCNGNKCSGARWSSFAYRRDMKPVYKLLPPATEVLFGTFLLPVPAARNGFPQLTKAGENVIETRLDLCTNDSLRTCLQVELRASVKPD